MEKQELERLEEICRYNRCNVVKTIHNAKSGHPGGSLSGIDIMTVLFEKVMVNDPLWDKSPNFANRDRFVLSKGHASPAYYSVLAKRGYFPEEELQGFRQINRLLQGHPNNHIPGVEVPTGSLGQGVSMACGIAMALKLDKNPTHVFALTGDGELQEGSCWEAFMHAPHRGLNNLTVIIDRNNLQIDGSVDTIKGDDPLDKKHEAFNWKVVKIDGHNVKEIYEALTESKKSDKPTAIIAKTVKGKGVSFMENQCGWHGKSPNDDECKKALEELS
ncbi:transketolase [bacterium]|nr:transketolase [bacterium]